MKSMTLTLGKITGMILFSFCMLAGDANGKDGVVSDALIHRAGLQVQWFSHAGTGVRSELADWHLTVNENKPTTFFTIRHEGYRETFSQNKLSPFGKPYGIDDAIQYAGVRKDVLTAELANDGIEDPQVLIDQYTLPESTIYLLTSTGGIKAIDADTGEVRWKNQVGDSFVRATGVGADFDHVAVVSGKSLFCLEAATGKVLWKARCRHGVSASPTVSEESIYVPLVNGRLEVFELENKGVLTKTLVANGEGISRPIVTEKTVSWSTEQGQMNVASRMDGKTVAYQLRADDGFECSPAFKSGKFYATSLDGFIYAVDEDRGTIDWQISTGAPISESPVPLKDSVFVINSQHKMYKIRAKDGKMADGWKQPRTGISRFIGAGKTSMFVLDTAGNLKVMSQDSGAVLSTVPFGDVDKVLHNLDNDRLYVASRQGVIQCIREVSSAIPHFHANELGVIRIDPADIGAKAKAADKPKKDGGADPFKSLNDPFASGRAKSADPFAKKPAGDDPFGGPAKPSKKVDDPFGGGSDDDDPFK